MGVCSSGVILIFTCQLHSASTSLEGKGGSESTFFVMPMKGEVLPGALNIYLCVFHLSRQFNLSLR